MSSDAPDTPPQPRVLLTVLYDSGIDERLTGALEEVGVAGWTKIFGAHGHGGTGRKEDTPIWPGTVNVLTIALEATEVERVVARLRELQRSYRRNPGLTLWTQPIEVW